MRYTVHYTIPLLAVMLGLSACSGGLGRSLGFEKSSPDEFDVMSRPPLSLPPDYSLRPPRPGAAGPNSRLASERAQKTLLGKNRSTDQASGDYTAASQAEASLLSKAGQDDARSDIRTILNTENGTDDAPEDGFWSRLKAGTLLVDEAEAGAAADSPDTLNPGKERERLAKQRAEEFSDDSPEGNGE